MSPKCHQKQCFGDSWIPGMSISGPKIRSTHGEASDRELHTRFFFACMCFFRFAAYPKYSNCTRGPCAGTHKCCCKRVFKNPKLREGPHPLNPTHPSCYVLHGFFSSGFLTLGILVSDKLICANCLQLPESLSLPAQ